ncbi:Methylmalonic aciduria and homocystinuria type D-like protein [Zancudomyces culisetae]|uniref:Methylmalonic aciduria and homocystinuria type D-like protein n=1 Tax=Zancudomyces culisetae TaxID=1213189 RepID=A0A1R1PT36_ZANCU|nr:Methylmalonic aciduria and homocystinuria type D-like protein [Zancudomyces culisetae]|eukprot:OMH84128.1 Methylmalonic aciduria and homocystinuria type D-like protein [Zancudomyces culisetae]
MITGPKIEIFKLKNLPLNEQFCFSSEKMARGEGQGGEENMPGEIEVKMEYSIHKCPNLLKQELLMVFPGIKNKMEKVLIIPTFQQTRSSMMVFDRESDIEKDEKLGNFYSWGKIFVESINKFGYWADIVCPASGIPVYNKDSTNTIYSEVNSCQRLLKYQTINIGQCNMVSHPKWSTSVYPATAFTTAPIDIVERVLEYMKKRV